MSSMRFPREFAQVKGNVFIISPFGSKVLAAGKEPHDFDEVIREVIAPAIRELGMTPVRADWMFGGHAVMDIVWRGIQQAELIVADLSGRAPNVLFELALAAAIGKRVVFLTQDEADIPSDLQGVRYIKYGRDFLAIKKMTEELANQLGAMREEPAVELGFTAFGQGATEPAPGQVHAVERDLVTVRTDDGRYGVLSRADVEWGRLIPDMTARFRVGARVEGGFDTKSMKYTLTGGQSNPWPTIESSFEVGTRFASVVQNTLAGRGVFVKVFGPVKGLLPLSSGPEVADLQGGDEVEVIVTRVDIAERKVQVRLARRMEAARPVVDEAVEVSDSLTLGMQIDDAEVVNVVPEKDGRGGFILVTAPQDKRRAMMLHCKSMSPELRRDLNNGQVERGELLTVIIDKIDNQRGRISVHDVPVLEADDSADGSAAA